MPFTKPQTDFIAQRARVMMNEVLKAILLAEPFYGGGTVPSLMNVRSYSDLHDLCDANTLGGWCDDEGNVAMHMHALWPEIGNGAEHSGNWLEGAADAQEFVNHWIVRGAMREDVIFLSGVLDSDEVECLLSEHRWIEAHGMVDDREARVGGKFSKAACDRLRTFLPARPQWMKEFPRFVDEPGMQGIVESIPPAFRDESWHNDAMPSWCLHFGSEVEDRGYRLWVAEAKVEDREIQSGTRFALTKGPYGDPANCTTLLETDDWPTMLDALSKLPGEEPAPGTVAKVDTAESLLRELAHVVVFDPETGLSREQWNDLMQRITRFENRKA